MYTTLRSGRAGSVDATVVLAPKPARVAAADEPADASLAGAYAAARKRPEFTGEMGNFVDLEHDGRRFLVVGIGETEKHVAQAVRIAAATVTGPMHARALKAVAVAATPAVAGVLDGAAIGGAFAEGVSLAAFRYERFRKPEQPEPRRLTLRSGDAAMRRGFDEGIRLGASTNFARELQATPPNIASPYYIAEQARKLAAERGSRLKCTVFKGDALKKHKFVGLMNVGQASDHKPCMIQLEYRSKRRNAPTVVLVGKTLTFDCSRLSLKISGGMRNMKYDKSGGMAVLGAMHAIRKRELKCHVIGLLPAAENAISDEAYRVDDIIAYPNGVSVEVTNTDAEGRLVLADALHYASKRFKPAAMVDLATLTGAIVAALGDHMAGMFSDSETLRQGIGEAAERSGEPVWHMPITQEHRDALRSNHADVVNSPFKGTGGACTAAAFLERFVGSPERWVHLDIAGPVLTETAHPIFQVGPTGFGVRLLTHFLEGFQ